MPSHFNLKRAYDKPEAADGARYLVDRLWPRGVKKTSLKLDGWLKEVAPSSELRAWFHHEPDKWSEFKRRYFAELNADPAAWQPLAEAAKQGIVTLIFSAHDAEHNNAVALAEYLEKHSLKKKPA